MQFTMEANCAASAGVSDMLVQGWRDVVRIFPAIPDHWRDAAFRDLLTEGAFRVSAVRRGGRTIWVRIIAGVARTLRLRTPFGEAEIEIEGAALRREGSDLVGQLGKGQEVLVHLKGESVEFERAARQARQGDTARIGLR